ncbi:glycosyltransferase FcbB [Moraxella macacae 0408225]|uniref:Glycosyltransferase FcbB n=1 Tax=Moraxella macacae 0408225 TaxID=1230338 RepID=L2F8R5_9GAMM|nr:glycosyltransferase family A protein [Moraxella macacae]ELA09295.1 glycosyltransferase FcbB [Moraxella macacae 0408225]
MFDKFDKKPAVFELATHSESIRYCMPKNYWHAVQLGLYQTVLKDHWTVLPKSKCAYKLSQLKRFQITKSDAAFTVHQLLTNKYYWFHQKAIVIALLPLYPAKVFKFLHNNRYLLVRKYYLGVYVALCHHFKQSIDEKLLKKLPSDDINTVCLLNNIVHHTTQSKLDTLNHFLLNNHLTKLTVYDKNQQLSVNNLTCHHVDPVQQNMPLVSILVTVYNASDTIVACIDSLLNQSYKNLQIIIINDCSTDDSLQKLQALKNKDKRIVLIDLPKNVGTFVAKNIGATYATGEFITCQDSDDFAHPQKIEQQTLPLLSDKNLIATLSDWLRIDEHGQFYIRQFYPFLRQNPASPLFRRKLVMQKTGLWHNVRTGADSEFLERLKVVFGNHAIARIKLPLTFASHRDNSLMTSKEFGIYNQKSALDRLDYWEHWRLWHIDCLSKQKMPVIPNVNMPTEHVKLFSIPKKLVLKSEDIDYCLLHHKVY